MLTMQLVCNSINAARTIVLFFAVLRGLPMFAVRSRLSAPKLPAMLGQVYVTSQADQVFCDVGGVGVNQMD